MGSETFSVRIPKKLKEDMKKLPVNWQEEVRSFIECRVRAEKARLLVEGVKPLRDRTKRVGSAELIREDRSR
ncbi:MAG: antitoxin [Thermosphaera sp.]